MFISPSVDGLPKFIRFVVPVVIKVLGPEFCFVLQYISSDVLVQFKESVVMTVKLSNAVSIFNYYPDVFWEYVSVWFYFSFWFCHSLHRVPSKYFISKGNVFTNSCSNILFSQYFLMFLMNWVKYTRWLYDEMVEQ